MRELAEKYDLRVPRYTSYPTAPHFTEAVGPETYRQWLTEVPTDKRLSLYLHIPYCDELCWFCGCLTKITRRYQPIADYVAVLLAEIERVADLLPGRFAVGHIHWGGGSPTTVSAADFERITSVLHERFAVAEDAEHAVELDPRTTDEAYVKTLAACGVTRASIGVQDFDPRVQEAVNRVQPYEVTATAIERLRAAGVPEVNMDLMYGLPHQTAESVADTVERALAFEPSRIALFGYAHVPWMKKHQRMMPEDALPDADERWRQYDAAEARLTAHGYTPIGLDHYAAPGDLMAEALRDGTLHRNFQGYTTDREPVLLGFGASAIGTLPQGYVQNTHRVHAYRRAVMDDGDLATCRGVPVSEEDRFRRRIIETLMCHMEVDLAAVAGEFGRDPAELADDVERLRPLEEDGVLVRDGWHLRVPDEARVLVRLVAAAFDQYLEEAGGERRHSRAV